MFFKIDLRDIEYAHGSMTLKFHLSKKDPSVYTTTQNNVAREFNSARSYLLETVYDLVENRDDVKFKETWLSGLIEVETKDKNLVAQLRLIFSEPKLVNISKDNCATAGTL